MAKCIYGPCGSCEYQESTTSEGICTMFDPGWYDADEDEEE